MTSHHLEPNRLLTVSDYLLERGLVGLAARRIYSPFGRLLKRKYLMAHNRPPVTRPRYINGWRVQVCIYRERDRALFDLVLAELKLNIRISF